MIKLLLLLIISLFVLNISPRESVQTVELSYSHYFDCLDRKVKAVVEGPYVEIQYTFTYKNKKDYLVTADFKIIQEENDISHKVEIKHENQDIVRFVFEEMSVPQYQKKTQFAEKLFLEKRVPVGNVRGYEIVHIIITVMKPLKTHLNHFYELSLISFYRPQAHDYSSREIFAEAKRLWNVQIELKAEKPFAILANPKHNFKPKLSNHTDRLSGTKIYKAFYNVTVLRADFFTIFFAPQDFNAPQTIMATHPFNPHDHAFMFSLIPDMNYLPDGGSPHFHEEIQHILGNLSHQENLPKLKEVIIQSDLHYFPNEYLFIIDRSDSMKEPSFENLKKTLNKFLETLSKSASFFSILSFGNSSQLHWKKLEGDIPYKTPENTIEIMKWVETLEADMGKKDLLSALKYAFEEYEWTPLLRNVIILTGEKDEDEEEYEEDDEEDDEKVSKMDEIIQLIQANSVSQKVCALKIEEEYEYIIQEIGAAGGCQVDFSGWSEYFFGKALTIMDATLKSPEFNLAYEIKCLDEPGFVVHQEEGEFDGIGKDQAFIKWVTLNSIPNLKSCKAKIFYYSQHRCSSRYEEIEIFRSQKAELTDVWHKVASHAKLHDEKSKRKLMVNNIQEEDPTKSDLNSFDSQEILQKELIPNEISRSLCEVYQERFNDLWCFDPKRPLLNSGYDPSDFSSEYKVRENESASSKYEENEEESFFLFKTSFIVGVCTLLFVEGLIM